MIAPLSSFTPALSGMAGVSLRMGGTSDGYKPWDVKQEGGQMESGWGTGEFHHQNDFVNFDSQLHHNTLTQKIFYQHSYL